MSDKNPIHPSQIVVTGAAGFIGRRVVARLAARGVRVLAVDRAPFPAALPGGVDYRCGDFEKDFVEAAEGCGLIHLAWEMDRKNAAAQAASVAGFRRLLELGGWSGVVGLGSAEEYGELEGELSEEMAPGRRLSPYGRAKHEACCALETWSRGASGRRALWLRPFVVYGPGQGGNMVIPYAVHCAAARQKAELTEGLQRRDFIHVDDVADGIAQLALCRTDANGSFAACNLGRGEPVRVRDVLERIAERMDARQWFRFGARSLRPNEPQEQYAEVLAAKMRGWRAQIPWEQGIDDLCRELGKEHRG